MAKQKAVSKNTIVFNNLVTNILGILKLVKKTQTVASTKSFIPKEKFTQDQSKDLTRYTLELDQKKAVLDKIKERIKQL